MRRGDAEVEQHAVQAVGGGFPVRKVGEAAAMDQHARVRAELVFGDRDRFGILVHEQQPASGAQALQHATRMSAPPERAIQIRSVLRSEEHTSELQSLMRLSYAVFCLKNKTNITNPHLYTHQHGR